METSPTALSNRSRLQLTLTGIIHVGANECEEWKDYQKLGAERVLWIDGNELSLAKGKSILEKNGITTHAIIPVYLSHYDGTELFYFTLVGSRNDSLMRPNGYYIETTIKDTKSVQVTRLDTLLARMNVDISLYNTLVIDVQGAELKVLAGCGALLQNIDIIVIEAWINGLNDVNTGVYEGATSINDATMFLAERGFEETYRIHTPREIWMDVLFEKKSRKWKK